jgi:hypothetical protein
MAVVKGRHFTKKVISLYISDSGGFLISQDIEYRDRGQAGSSETTDGLNVRDYNPYCPQ